MTEPSAVKPFGDAIKPFEAAIDVAKALLTLATAVITLTITFSKDILGSATHGERALLGIAWFLFFLSIIGGIWLLYAATGSISETSATRQLSVYDSNTAIPMAVQQIFFLAGVLLTAVFGVLLI